MPYKQLGQTHRLAKLSVVCLTFFLSACTDGQEDVTSEPSSRNPIPWENRGPALSGPAAVIVSGTETTQPARRQEGIIFRGTGFFTRDTGTPEAGDVPGDVTLNFVDADIADVVEAVVGDALQLNYAIDPEVQGQITLQTATPITRDAILPTLEAALQLSGVALLRSPNDLYMVMPISAAQNRPGLPRLGGAGQGFGLQIVQLRYVTADDMQKILSAVAPQGGVVYADAARNLLILSGTDQDTRTLIDTINLFDVNYLKGASYGIFTPRNVRVSVLVDELEQVLQGTPVDGLIKLIPIERVNAILAIAREPDLLADLREWVNRLDVEDGEGPDRRVYLYHVQNAKAVELAETLTTVFGLDRDITAAPVAVDPGRQSRSAADLAVRTAQSDPSLQPQGGSGIAGRATPDAGGAVPDIRGDIPDVRSDIPDLGGTTLNTGAGTTPDAGNAAGGLAAVSTSGMRIIADQTQNLLIIYATLKEYRLVEDALKNIDFAPDQVLIEATIAEVDLTDDFKFGIQWSVDVDDGSLTFTDDATGGIVSRFPGFSAAYLASGVRSVLNALAKRTDVNVISSPKILVLDNQPAVLEVGDEVPIATQSARSVTNPDAPIVNQIEFRQTGVILEVTPRINKSGLVTLDIAQEVSDVASTTSSTIDSPTIQQRRIISTVAVQSGATVALGGLIRETVTEGETGVPFLKDIPFLGALFRSTDNNQRRTELIVFLTPRIIRNPADALAMTNYLRDQLSDANLTATSKGQ